MDDVEKAIMDYLAKYKVKEFDGELLSDGDTPLQPIEKETGHSLSSLYEGAKSLQSDGLISLREADRSIGGREKAEDDKFDGVRIEITNKGIDNIKKNK